MKKLKRYRWKVVEQLITTNGNLTGKPLRPLPGRGGGGIPLPPFLVGFFGGAKKRERD